MGCLLIHMVEIEVSDGCDTLQQTRTEHVANDAQQPAHRAGQWCQLPRLHLVRAAVSDPQRRAGEIGLCWRRRKWQ